MLYKSQSPAAFHQFCRLCLVSPQFTLLVYSHHLTVCVGFLYPFVIFDVSVAYNHFYAVNRCYLDLSSSTTIFLVVLILLTYIFII